MPRFEEFSRQYARSVEEPMFSVQTRGNISLNRAAFEALGEPASVTLLFDREAGVVGLRKAPRTHQNAYPVRKQQAARSYLIAAQGFTSYYGIPTDVSRRFVGHDYGEGVCGFVLSEGAVIRGSRAKAQQPEEPTHPEVSLNGKVEELVLG